MGASTRAEVRTPDTPTRLTLNIPGASKGVTAATSDLDVDTLREVGADWTRKLIEGAGHKVTGNVIVVIIDSEEPDPDPPEKQAPAKAPARKRAKPKPSGGAN